MKLWTYSSWLVYGV